MRIFSIVLVSAITSASTAAGILVTDARFHWLSGAPEVAQRQVPHLVGLPEADARVNLEALGLKVLIAGREPSMEVEVGAVLRQAPAAGQLLREGEAVHLTFALAPRRVPDVIGKPVADARRLLEEEGYAVQVADSVNSDEHAEGLIAGQIPEAGAPLQKAQLVVLKPSAGAANVEVPKLVGMALSAAQAAAEELRLKPAIKWISRAETPTDIVLRQTPAPGESVLRETQVELVVNR